MKIKIDVRISALKKWNKHKSHINAKNFRNIAAKAMEIAGIRLSCQSVECAVLLSDDAEVQIYNSNFRSIDRPTNVLSFPYEANLRQNLPNYTKENLQLGDIILSFDRIKEEVNDEIFCEYVYYLFIHGFLHLLGYVHDKDFDREEMEALEDKILRSLGVSKKSFI